MSSRPTPTRKSGTTQTKARVQRAPRRHAPAAVAQRLQRQLGNQATQRLLQAMVSRETGVQRSEMEEEERLQGKLESVQPQGSEEREVASELESAINRKRGSGQALERGVRGQTESAFKADFGGVRVHTGRDADQLNRQLGARAFTTGRDIFFRSGEYNPGSSSGRELLAHELAHVVQQTGRLHNKMALSQPGDRFEREATEAARAVIQQEKEGTSTVSRRENARLQTEEEGAALAAIPHEAALHRQEDPNEEEGFGTDRYALQSHGGRQLLTDVAQQNGRQLQRARPQEKRQALQQTVGSGVIAGYLPVQANKTYLQRNAEVLWGRPDAEGRRSGYSLRPIAELWVQGRKQAQVDFNGHSRLTTNLDLPEGTRGIIQMRLQAHSFSVAGGGLVGPRRHDSPFRHSYLAEWRVDATGNELSLSFHRAQRQILSVPRETVTFSHAEQGATLRITFTARQEPPFGTPREMIRVVSLRVRRPVQVRIGPVATQATLSVGPFAPDRARISPSVRSAVRRFYNSLDESTRRAIQANERPAGRMIVIEGYASTTGSQEHNDDLATARAVAVRDLLKQFSGNSRNDIFVTPSFGESRSPTATDVRSQEVEDPRYRKVVIRLWQQSGSGTTVTVPPRAQ